jgi:Uma2 family endonuclease
LAAVEARHRPAGDQHNDRMPDVSLVLGKKPVERQGAADYMPDVVVEVQSPDDSWREMIRRGVFYLDHGARAVLLIYPGKQQVEVLMGDDRQLLSVGDTIDLGVVMPEFTMAVADVFRGL